MTDIALVSSSVGWIRVVDPYNSHGHRPPILCLGGPVGSHMRTLLIDHEARVLTPSEQGLPYTLTT